MKNIALLLLILLATLSAFAEDPETETLDREALKAGLTHPDRVCGKTAAYAVKFADALTKEAYLGAVQNGNWKEWPGGHQDHIFSADMELASKDLQVLADCLSKASLAQGVDQAGRARFLYAEGSLRGLASNLTQNNGVGEEAYRDLRDSVKADPKFAPGVLGFARAFLAPVKQYSGFIVRHFMAGPLRTNLVEDVDLLQAAAHGLPPGDVTPALLNDLQAADKKVKGK